MTEIESSTRPGGEYTPAPSDAPRNGGARLERSLGVRELAFNGVNMVIGTTVLLVPALIAAEVGTSGTLAVAACAALMSLVVLCFAEAGSRVSRSGGTYAWAEAAFGPWTAFVLGVVLYVGGQVIGAASVLLLMLGALASIAPWTASPVARVPIVLALIGALVALNIRGVRESARAVEIVTVVKLLPLVIILIAALPAVQVSNLAITSLPTADHFGRAVLLVLFLFAGIENALTPSGEVRDPARTVPRAVLLALVIVTVLYVGTQAIAQGAMGAELAQYKSGPIAELGGRQLGATGRGLVLFAMIVAPLAYTMGDLLATSRMLYALASDGYLPRAVAKVHPRFHTPWVAIVLHGVLLALFTLTRTFEWLLFVSTVATALVYLVCCLATIRLRVRDVRTVGVPFRLPGGLSIPVLAALLMVALLASAKWQELAAVAVMIGVASLLYTMRRRRPGHGELESS